MYLKTAALLLVTSAVALAADFSGAWIAELKALGAEPTYARLSLQATGSNLQGTWNQQKVSGTISGDKVTLTLTGGTLTGTVTGASIVGEGEVSGLTPRSRAPEHVRFTLNRPAVRNGAPRTHDFEPKAFYGYFSSAIAPVLHVFPGDTVRTRTYDQSGRDNDKRTPGANLETGPFYVEGALPGDTLAVQLKRVKLNRDSARQGNRINGRAVTPAWNAAAQYDPNFDSEWKLDREKGIAMLAHPSPGLKNFTVPILPMLGCIATAPQGAQSYRATDLGPFGGNMDYNQMGEGVTLYLPVYHPGALLTMGDAHAAMGDAELTGSALETSVDVEFSVQVIPGYQSVGPRLENADYIMAMGIAGSVADSIQVATSQLADWLKKDYKLNDSEVAVLLGAVAKYDITELVDPQFNVVAKVPKKALQGLGAN